jgi:hypothetical protein
METFPLHSSLHLNVSVAGNLISSLKELCMSQYWGPPNYPPRPPQRYQLPPPEYAEYPDQNETLVRRAFYFLGGGCLATLVIGGCVCVLAFLWVIDARFGITGPPEIVNTGAVVTPVFEQNTVPVQPNRAGVPVQPGQPIQSAPAETNPQPNQPAAIGQPVVAVETGMELTVFDIQREIQPINLAPAEGMEFTAISVQLRNTSPLGQDQSYSVANFQIQDIDGNLYPPDVTADNGRRLNDGVLSSEAAIEGDLLFHIPLGKAPLVLVWTPTASTNIYSVALQ